MKFDQILDGVLIHRNFKKQQVNLKADTNVTVRIKKKYSFH